MTEAEKTGLLFAAGGFVLLSIGDGIVKSMAGLWPFTAVAALRYAMGAVGLAVLLWRREGRSGFAIRRPAIQIMRGFGVAVATMGFFGGVYVLPLATATAIVFLSPLITAALAIVMLGEPSRRATWVALLAGFVGVIVIVRPDPTAFDLRALLPLGAACGMSMVMIGNRMSARLASPLAMQFSIAAIGAVFLGAATLAGHLSRLAPLMVATPDWHVVLRCGVVAITATSAHWLVYLGTTRAGAATVAPTNYVQILVASLIGLFLFGDIPDIATVAGAAIIIGAGLYLWRSGRVQAPERSE